LKECEIETIMATGDNTLTAIAVSKQCNILDKNAPVYSGDIIDGKFNGDVRITK
jgi:magnesium-transporting ATPase (P-type)